MVGVAVVLPAKTAWGRSPPWPTPIGKSWAADLLFDIYNTLFPTRMMDGAHVGINIALETFTYLYY